MDSLWVSEDQTGKHCPKPSPSWTVGGMIPTSLGSLSTPAPSADIVHAPPGTAQTAEESTASVLYQNTLFGKKSIHKKK